MKSAMWFDHCKIGVLTGLLLLFAAAACWADEEHVNENQGNWSEASVGIGYRGVSKHGESGRAREYDAQEASPTLDLSFRGSAGEVDISTDFKYLNDKDYTLDADLNNKALYRLHLRNERFYHNLDHIPYDQDTDPSARPDAYFDYPPDFDDPGAGFFPGNLRVDYNDENPGRDFGIRLDLYEAAVRAKLPHYPAHLNLKYWRWEKSGQRQLRYLNEGCAASCHMNSASKKVDMVTDEVTAGFDAHVGWFDVAFEQVFRWFDDQSDVPDNVFEGHYLRKPFTPAATAPPYPDYQYNPSYVSDPDYQAFYQHDETPDSNYRSSTIKAHTALGGGFVANASFSIGKRENDSDSLSDVGPVKAETDLKKFASDVTYTPSSHWTWNFRYRRLDLDSSNNSQITLDGAQYLTPAFTLEDRAQAFPVRESMDLDRDFYSASVSYRPTPKMSFKLDYHREDIDRSNTNGPVLHESLEADPVTIDPYWELPDEESITKVRFSMSSRSLKKNALKVKAWWEYQTTNDPAYSISYENANTVFFSASYRPGMLWGGIASLRFQEGRNNDFRRSLFDENEAVVYRDQDRDHSQQNASLGLWYNPTPGLNLDLNYGYLRSRVRQDLLFGKTPPTYSIEDDDVKYRQTVQTISLGASWQLLDTWNCRLEGYHIRSEADYSPNFPVDPQTFASPAQLKEISKVDIRQNGIKGRLQWQFADHWAAGVEATFDDYDDRNSEIFDGSVQTYMANISRSW